MNVSVWEAMVWGMVGGLLLSGYDLYQDSQRPRSKRLTKDGLFWFAFAFRPVLGALLVLAYERSGAILNAISAVGTGLTGPTILQGLLRQGYRLPPTEEAEVEA